MKTVHERKYNYVCEPCTYGTQSKMSYEDHMAQKHTEQVIIQYKSEWYLKLCKGHISLKKHQKFKLCTLKKIFQCDMYKKFYKTTVGLNYYKQTEHENQANRPVSPNVGKASQILAI